MTSSPLSRPTSPIPAAIPGDFGWPVIGPLSDRLQYFWFQGPAKFFKQRTERYKSTVFRTNVPPTFPFFVGVDPRVVAVLDVKSFGHLFRMDLVEKKNVLVGDFMPSLKFTGGTRACAYMDTTEEKHLQVKDFAIDILNRSSKIWLPTLQSSLSAMWESLESKLSGGSGGAGYLVPIQKFLFTFLSRTILGADPSSVPEIADSGYVMLDKWVALQVLPVTPINFLQPLDEIFLHSFAYPFWLVKSDFEKLQKWIKKDAKETLTRAQTLFRLTEEEAVNNLLFILGFNAYGGFLIFLPSLLSNLAEQKKFHGELRREVREKTQHQDRGLSFDSLREMDLVNSFVYETLRLSPPVQLQYARARKDFDLASHDAVFGIRKGELLCGYQPQVMRDPLIFENPEDFVIDRFTKEKGGDELLKYLFWSNGPQIGSDGGGPSAANKQCPGRDIVPVTAAAFVADLFLRYDEVGISSGSFT
ncbi:fatty acid hydroperoxide lyase, partial [Genlisea aurea]